MGKCCSGCACSLITQCQVVVAYCFLECVALLVPLIISQNTILIAIGINLIAIWFCTAICLCIGLSQNRKKLIMTWSVITTVKLVLFIGIIIFLLKVHGSFVYSPAIVTNVSCLVIIYKYTKTLPENVASAYDSNTTVVVLSEITPVRTIDENSSVILTTYSEDVEKASSAKKNWLHKHVLVTTEANKD